MNSSMSGEMASYKMCALLFNESFPDINYVAYIIYARTQLIRTYEKAKRKQQKIEENIILQ